MNIDPQPQPESGVAATHRALSYCEHLGREHGISATGIVMAALAEACDAYEVGEEEYALALIGVCQYMAVEYRTLALAQHVRDEERRAYAREWHTGRDPEGRPIMFKTQGPPAA